jgi:hypothetical protein
MHTERITDPTSVSREEIAAILARGCTPIVQFSRPGYTPELLRSLDALCAEFGVQIQVRFYGYHRDGFDAAALSHLPHVRWLLVDGVMRIDNEECFWHLPSLERLSFGAFEFDRPDFLAGFALERFTGFALVETRKRNLDLAPLTRCGRLTELYINGHTRNIGAVAGLPKLTALHLRGIPRQQDLAFVGAVAGLRDLSLSLGGRAAIDEISHAGLESLHIARVRGLASLGSLGRFSALRRLQVEDQLQLREISLSGARLHELLLVNCKSLARIDGLDEQIDLAHFRTRRTALDLDHLVKRAWPPAMRILALYSGSEKWNKAARQELDRRGYREFGYVAPEPF